MCKNNITKLSIIDLALYRWLFCKSVNDIFQLCFNDVNSNTSLALLLRVFSIPLKSQLTIHIVRYDDKSQFFSSRINAKIRNHDDGQSWYYG